MGNEQLEFVGSIFGYLESESLAGLVVTVEFVVLVEVGRDCEALVRVDL